MNNLTGSTHRPRSAGPPPGPLATVSLALAIAGIATVAALSQGQALGTPFVPDSDLLARTTEHALALRIGALLQFGAAVPLGIYTAAAYARQQRLGIRAPGPVIALYGGIAASLLLMSSALAAWTASRPELAGDVSSLRTLALLAFATGGVGYAVGLGLLIAGIAVPGLILALLPRWLAWTGLALAALAEISFLSLVLEPLQVLLPIVRFGGGLWLIAAGFLLPVNRAHASRKVRSQPQQ